MSADKPEIPKEDRRLFRWGSWATVVYIGLMSVYAVSNWSHMLAMDPNEFGDFLAGVFSPVAFLWLVLGFLQQGHELRLQIVELRHSVEAQNDLVQVSRERQEFDARVLETEHERAARMAAPILQFSATGSGGGNGGMRKYTFRVLNEGKPISGARLFLAGELANVIGNLDTGGHAGFSRELPMNNTPLSIPVKLTYFDTRLEPGEAHALIERETDRVTISRVPSPPPKS